MKKILAAVAVLFSVIGFGFSENFVNITIPLNVGANMFIYDVTTYENISEYPGFKEVNSEETRTMVTETIGVTGEFLHTFGGNFAVGGKLGIDVGPATFIDSRSGNENIKGSVFGWRIAPACGWIFPESKIKKQITLYPFQYFGCTYGGDLSKDEKLAYSCFKSGAAFSWQWGEKIWHGFELGFDINYNGIYKAGGEKADNRKAFGFDARVAYKCTLPM